MKPSLLPCLLALALATFFASPARADEPPSRDAYERTSANGRYEAQIRRDSTTQTFTLTVRRADCATCDPLWSAPFEHNGYPDGLLSDDGRTFVQIDVWYRDTTDAVRIYRKGAALRRIAGKRFAVPASKRTRTVSHELWLADDEPARLVRNRTLEIRTIDGAVHRIDVKTGRLKP